MPPECPHLLTEGQVLTDILWAPVVLPPAVLQVPHPPTVLGGRVHQLQCGGAVGARIGAELLCDGEVPYLQGRPIILWPVRNASRSLGHSFVRIECQRCILMITLFAPDTSVSMTIRCTSHSCTMDQKLWTVLAMGPWAAI